MSSPVLPVRRNLRFFLPKDNVSRWNGGHLHVSHFFNTLSIFFPVGERFFIDSVRHYRDQIDDPELQKAVSAFIGQEAMHGREHEEYNAALTAAGLPADRFERGVTRLLQKAQRQMPADVQLGVTVSLEHWTAVLAHLLLQEQELLADADPHYKAIWQWHALEETEHKGVAFDVFEQVVGKGPRAYAIRAGTQLLATGVFWLWVYRFYFQIVRQEGEQRNWRGWRKSFQFQWGRPGILRKSIPLWLDYFRPNFHPWQQDNRDYLQQLDALVQRVDAFEAEAEAEAEAGNAAPPVPGALLQTQSGLQGGALA